MTLPLGRAAARAFHPAEETREIVEHLRTATLIPKGPLRGGSNETVLVDAEGIDGVWKPNRGARPLGDYDVTRLGAHEAAAFEVTQGLGDRWQLVPPTVLRQGPGGEGSLQLFVGGAGENMAQLIARAQRDPNGPEAAFLRRMAAFDEGINAGDRKRAHVVVDEQGQGALIDNGLSFHTQNKLRSAYWDLAGTPLPQDIKTDLRAFAERLNTQGSEVRERLLPLLAPDRIVYGDKIGAMSSRIENQLARGTFAPSGSRPYGE